MTDKPAQKSPFADVAPALAGYTDNVLSSRPRSPATPTMCCSAMCGSVPAFRRATAA